MATQLASSILPEKEIIPPNWFKRLGLFILFLACGFAILVFGSNYFEIFPTNKNLTYNLTLSVLFLVVALWLKRDKYRSKHWRIAYAFFVASVAFPVTLLLSRWSDVVLGWFDVTVKTSQGIA